MPALLRASEFCQRPRTVTGGHRPPPPLPSPSGSPTLAATVAAHAQRDGDPTSPSNRRRRLRRLGAAAASSGDGVSGTGDRFAGDGFPHPRSPPAAGHNQAVVVRASILSELPSSSPATASSRGCGRRRGRRGGGIGDDVDDAFAMVYASHPDLLVGLNAVEGRLCALFRVDCDDDDDGHGEGMSPSILSHRAWAPVVLQVLPRRERRRRENSRRRRGGPDRGREVGDANGEDAGHDEGGDGRLVDANAVTERSEKDKDEKVETFDEDGGGDDHRRPSFESSFILHVPPCVAATAGIHDCIPSSLTRVGIVPLPLPQRSHSVAFARPRSTSASAVSMSPAVPAGRATLREIGIPPTDLLPPSCSPGGLLARPFLDAWEAEAAAGGDDGRDEGVRSSSSSRGGRVEALRSYFSRARLVGRGTILAVGGGGGGGDSSSSPSSIGDKSPSSSSAAVRFYQVVDASPSPPSSPSSENDEGAALRPRPPRLHQHENPACFLISPETRLTLLGRGEANVYCPGPVPRLPPPSVAASFHCSVATVTATSAVGRRNGGAGPSAAESRGGSVGSFEVVDDGVDFSLHPSIGGVVDLLLHASSSAETSSVSGAAVGAGGTTATGTRCVFVEGSEDNLVGGCIESAADMVGMRCLHVDGLAAFSYRYRLPASSSTAAVPTAPPNVTGSISDKLIGLEAALSAASETDCVLHLANFDEELPRFAGGGGAEAGSGGGDPERAEDEERRIASAVRGGLCSRPRSGQRATAAHRGGGGPGGGEEGFGVVNGGDVSARPIPAVCSRATVVISSKRPLSSDGGGGGTGPIASLSSLPAARVVEPDERFARHLWCLGEDDDDDDDGTFDAAESVLAGRTAREIQAVRRRLSREVAPPTGPHDDGAAVAEAVRSILESMDDGPVGGGGRSKLSSSLIPDVRWDDVGGLAHVRAEIMDAIELPLLHPHLFDRCPRGRSGVLLYGPPGTGKTLVAKAVATECGVPFLSVKGPELLGSYVGESEGNVRAAFASARRAASAHGGRGCAILFFDELDSLAPRRGGAGDGGGVMDRVVASLLGELDEHDGGTRGDDDALATTRNGGDLFVIGATNRPDLLDPSLLRPGRFDRHVYLGLCTGREDRVQILAAQMRNFTFENGLDAESAARAVMDEIPSRLSGADFSAISSGALMRSLARKCDEVDEEAKRLSLERNAQKRRSDQVHDCDVHAVLEVWDESRLRPIVSLQDIISAASSVHPSVGEEDLRKYEALKSQFGG